MNFQWFAQSKQLHKNNWEHLLPVPQEHRCKDVLVVHGGPTARLEPNLNKVRAERTPSVSKKIILISVSNFLNESLWCVLSCHNLWSRNVTRCFPLFMFLYLLTSWGLSELPWPQFLGAQTSSNIMQQAGEHDTRLFQGKGDMEDTWSNANVSLNLDSPSSRRNTFLRKHFLSLWHGMITDGNSDYWHNRCRKAKTTIATRSYLNMVIHGKQTQESSFWIILHMEQLFESYFG